MVSSPGQRHPGSDPPTCRHGCRESSSATAAPRPGHNHLVADRLRGVTQNWVSSGRLDPNEASALVDDVLKALRGETPELEQQMGRNLERNRDNLLQDFGVPSQKEVDELRGRIDRLEQQLRQINRPE